MVDVMSYALEFIQAAGLVAVFVLIVLDSAMLAPGFPAEVIVIIAIAQWGTDAAGLLLVFAIAVLGSLVGALLLWAIGWKSAGRALEKRKSILGVGPKRIEKMQETFSKPSGSFLLFIGRLFPLTRVIVSLPAGVARMPFWRYTIITTIGTALFYAIFLWITYEFQDPDSEIAATTSGVQAAYGTPAMQYIETNWIVSAAIVLLIAVVLTIRASRKMARDPEESGATLIGFAAILGLVGGGTALLAGLWMDPILVYEFLARGGIHASAWSIGIPFEPDSILALIGGAAILIGLWLSGVRGRAKQRHQELRKQHDKLAFQGRLKPAEVRRGTPPGGRRTEPGSAPPSEWHETRRAGGPGQDKR